MRVFAIKRLDGGVSIFRSREQDWTRDLELHVRHADKAYGVVSYREIAEDSIPRDDQFREAWTDDNPTETVDVDMGKARTIHMDNIRKLRDEKLRELDKETMKALNVQPAKQVLRDIPQTFVLTSAITPEELKALWPVELQ